MPDRIVSRFLQVEKNADWQYVVDTAPKTDTLKIVSLGLLPASELLGSEPPPQVAQQIDHESAMPVLATGQRGADRSGSSFSSSPPDHLAAHRKLVSPSCGTHCTGSPVIRP
jgi:hypothetical protein